MALRTLSDHVMKKWGEFNQAFRDAHAFSVVGLIVVNADAEVAVCFHPNLDKAEVDDLRKALCEPEQEWPPEEPKAGG